MKQFWKQILVGVLGIIALVIGGIILYFLALLIIRLCSLVPVEELLKNIKWIILGAILLLLIQLLGMGLLWFIGRRENWIARRKHTMKTVEENYDDDDYSEEN